MYASYEKVSKNLKLVEDKLWVFKSYASLQSHHWKLNRGTNVPFGH